MAYLRCPQCMFTNTVKKQDAPSSLCSECDFDIGKHYYSEKTQEEANNFIIDENLRIKKLKAKNYRENRKKEQNSDDCNTYNEIESTATNTTDWDWVCFKSQLILIVIMLAMFAGAASKFLLTEQTQFAVSLISDFAQNAIYSPVLKPLFDAIISIEHGVFYDLRLFLFTTSRGAFILTLSLVVFFIYLFSIFAYLKSSDSSIDKKMIYPSAPILIFVFSVTFASPNADLGEFGEHYIYFIYLISIGMYKLTNKLI